MYLAASSGQIEVIQYLLAAGAQLSFRNLVCSSLGRTVEIPCPTCPTWSQFIQDKLKISIYLSLDKYKFMFKVNTILYFIF